MTENPYRNKQGAIEWQDGYEAGRASRDAEVSNLLPHVAQVEALQDTHTKLTGELDALRARLAEKEAECESLRTELARRIRLDRLEVTDEPASKGDNDG